MLAKSSTRVALLLLAIPLGLIPPAAAYHENSIGLTLRYRWEADDTLGSERQSQFEAVNRAGTRFTHSHTTCQAGNPLLQTLGGSCGIL